MDYETIRQRSRWNHSCSLKEMRSGARKYGRIRRAIRTHKDPKEEIMKTHGTVIRGYHMPSEHRTWETVEGWMKRLFTRKNLTLAAASLIGLLMFGLMIWLVILPYAFYILSKLIRAPDDIRPMVAYAVIISGIVLNFLYLVAYASHHSN